MQGMLVGFTIGNRRWHGELGEASEGICEVCTSVMHRLQQVIDQLLIIFSAIHC